MSSGRCEKCGVHSGKLVRGRWCHACYAGLLDRGEIPLVRVSSSRKAADTRALSVPGLAAMTDKQMQQAAADIGVSLRTLYRYKKWIKRNNG